MEGLKKDTRKIKYFLMKTLGTTRATTCRTFSIPANISLGWKGLPRTNILDYPENS
jgi:hypothetical protein